MPSGEAGGAAERRRGEEGGGVLLRGLCREEGEGAEAADAAVPLGPGAGGWRRPRLIMRRFVSAAVARFCGGLV